MLEHDVPEETAPALRIPPHSIEAEQAILGGLLLDNNAWERVIDLVSEEDFFRHEHRLIYRAILELADAEMPFDAVTLYSQIETAGHAPQVGSEYLNELAQNTVSTSNIRTYALIVNERSMLRKIASACLEIQESASNNKGESLELVLERAELRIRKVAEQKRKASGARSLKSLLKQALGKIDERAASGSSLIGISTGYDELDKLTLGLQQTDLIIVAGRPSMGKTTFAMNLVEQAIFLQEKVVLVYSLEMPGESLLMRMLSSVGKIDHGRVRSGQLDDDDWPKLTDAVHKIRDRNLYMDDAAGISPTEMRSRTRKLERELGEIGLIMVDYLQLMQVPEKPGQSRASQISEISRSLKAVAKEFNCPVVALSQLNRSLEDREDKRPINSDLRESGAIEQDADVIMFVYRDEVYHPETERKGEAEIIIGKSRNGEIGTVNLGFEGKYMRFDNLPQAVSLVE